MAGQRAVIAPVCRGMFVISYNEGDHHVDIITDEGVHRIPVEVEDDDQ